MDDGVEAFKVARLQIAEVLNDGRDLDDLAALLESAAAIEVGVNAGDVMAGRAQHRRHHRTDIAQVTAQQDLHRSPHCSALNRWSSTLFYTWLVLQETPLTALVSARRPSTAL